MKAESEPAYYPQTCLPSFEIKLCNLNDKDSVSTCYVPTLILSHLHHLRRKNLDKISKFELVKIKEKQWKDREREVSKEKEGWGENHSREQNVCC